MSEYLQDRHELLYFWAIGDLHYRAREQWLTIHSQRLTPMFQDLRSVWHDEGSPAFCVSPGDIVDTGAPENYELAKAQLVLQLGSIPFYPGIGNHEFHRESKTDRLHTVAEYSQAWHKPVRYFWIEGEVLCIMLDQPNPYEPDPQRENPHVIFSQESLTFLDSTLARHSEHPAIIFAHCPLHNTVLDRDPLRNLDDDSQDSFFYIENSQDVRDILARNRNVGLYFSGHTHSGWGSPQLVLTETLGGHPVTHVNLMCPWYTGRHHGPRLSPDGSTLEYHPDTPDLIATFAVHIYHDQAFIRLRDHRAQQWLAQWTVPLSFQV
jgi:3',5'-cyclic AMP phosphodiesterase CpdA